MSASKRDRSKYMREYRLRNRSRIKEYSDGYKARNPREMMLNHAKMRAKKKGVSFSITVDDIVIPETCPVLGIPLKSRLGSGSGGRDDSPSLDRIKPALGYVPGNVVVMSLLANRIKTSANADQVKAVFEWMKKVESNAS